MTLPPREFITKAMNDAKTTFDVFDAIVGRMEADAAKIAELGAKHTARTREFIDWIDYTSSVIQGTSQDYQKARRKIKQLEKEIAP